VVCETIGDGWVDRGGTAGGILVVGGRVPFLVAGHSKGGADDVVERVSKDSSRLSPSASIRISGGLPLAVGVVAEGLSPPSDRDTEWKEEMEEA
jgi:hypothetical protein